MIELALNTFDYKDYNTLDLDGKRIYQISDDKLYPSITTVLGGTEDSKNKSILANWKARVGKTEADRVGKTEADRVSLAATNRGTNVHLMLERFLRNEDPQLSTFPEDHVKMFNSLRLEVKKINKVYGQEVVLYSDTFGIAGRTDLIAEYQGEMALIDYKTSKRVKSIDEIGDYWVQCYFYLTAHNEMFGTNIKKMIIMMGVENRLPMIFKKNADDSMLLKLAERSYEFYAKL